MQIRDQIFRASAVLRDCKCLTRFSTVQFYIKGHGVPQELIDRAFAAGSDFQVLPLT